jgi:hypothetical protein
MAWRSYYASLASLAMNSTSCLNVRPYKLTSDSSVLLVMIMHSQI